MRDVAARLSVALMCLLAATAVHAQPSQHSTTVPRVVRVTGVFVSANGQPVGPVETVTLAIYADEKGGAPLWQETQTIAVDAEGRYTVLLGASESDGLPMNLFASGDARWLGRRFERPGEQEQARVLLTSVPYALKASDAETLGGKPASAYVLAGGTADAGGVTTATVTTTPVTAADGTTGYIGKFISPTLLGDSVMYESAARIGVNTATPRDAFDVHFINENGGMTGVAVQNLGSTATSYSGMLFYDQNGVLGQFQGFNNSTHEYRINNIAPGGTINFMIGGSSKFKVANNGFVGINTASPAFPLEVTGSANFANTATSSYFYPSGGLQTGYAGTYSNVSIKASDFILGGLIGAYSDERIKKIRGRSDSAADLRTLLDIEVTDFVYKDAVEKGSRPQKKVIAQQVEKVFPQAVSQTTDVVPDIYRKAPIHNGWIELTTDLKVGDRVRLITENGHGAVHTVLEVTDKKFRTDFVDDADQVFVYGREVKDFRFVDYEAISMLNVSATQELGRIITQQDSELRALSARLAALEQMLKEQPRQKQQ